MRERNTRRKTDGENGDTRVGTGGGGGGFGSVAEAFCKTARLQEAPVHWTAQHGSVAEVGKWGNGVLNLNLPTIRNKKGKKRLPCKRESPKQMNKMRSTGDKGRAGSARRRREGRNVRTTSTPEARTPFKVRHTTTPSPDRFVSCHRVCPARPGVVRAGEIEENDEKKDDKGLTKKIPRINQPYIGRCRLWAGNRL